MSLPDATPRQAARRSRKALGAFYTPDEIAAAVARWAVPDCGGRVLDPSFGGGSFLRAALQVSSRNESGVSVHGADIDPATECYVQEFVDRGVPRRNFVLRDFFATTLADYDSQPFDAVIGNPPYIRHHSIERSDNIQAQKAVATLGLQLPKRSDLWAFFLPYSASYLARGGRLALVLPAAVLHATYAHPVLAWIADAFESVRLIEVEQRLFQGVAEASVVLAASGYGLGAAQHYGYDSVLEASQLWQVLENPPSSLRERSDTRPWAYQRLSTNAATAWERLVAMPQVSRLDELATIRIGVVTGGNNFFVRSTEDVPAVNGSSVRTTRILARSADVRRPIIEPDDLDRLDRLGRPTHLLVLPRERTTIEEMLTEAESAGLHERHHCRTREPWWVIADTVAPDAFLGYMGAVPGRVVLNRSSATCTNTIHRLTWTNTDRSPESIAAASWTSLYELGAELFGRWYGGGVLKLEPSEAGRLPIPVVDGADALLDKIAALVERGLTSEAVELADDVVLRSGLGATNCEITAIREATQELRTRRAGNRR
jgi:adenine-specific DNA-methyltransferase